jgi:hypothetical protein
MIREDVENTKENSIQWKNEGQRGLSPSHYMEMDYT